MLDVKPVLNVSNDGRLDVVKKLEGDPVIYIGFSSALIETFNGSVIDRNEIMEANPEADITVIDSKSASIGQGLLVYYASEMLKQGKSKEEIVEWIA